jgi:ankyrin repeat protein
MAFRHSKTDDSWLSQALASHDIETIKALVTAGCNLNQKIFGNYLTPLMFAARMNNKELITTLLDSSKIDINSQRADGNTALHLAAQYGGLEAVKALIEAQAKIGAKNRKGQSPLYIALLNNHKDIAKLLIDKGAKIGLWSLFKIWMTKKKAP